MKFQLFPLVVLTGLFVGCGSSTGPSYGGEEGRKIAQLVDALIDDRSDIRRTSAHFAQGSSPKPEEWKKLAPFSFELVGNPSITGTDATAKVRVVYDSDHSKEKGEVEWKFRKEGDKWKIVSAPIP